MARWDDGDVTDVTDTDNVYREMTPPWLALTAVLLGQRPPGLSARSAMPILAAGSA